MIPLFSIIHCHQNNQHNFLLTLKAFADCTKRIQFHNRWHKYNTAFNLDHTIDFYFGFASRFTAFISFSNSVLVSILFQQWTQHFQAHVCFITTLIVLFLKHSQLAIMHFKHNVHYRQQIDDEHNRTYKVSFQLKINFFKVDWSNTLSTTNIVCSSQECWFWNNTHPAK